MIGARLSLAHFAISLCAQTSGLASVLHRFAVKNTLWHVILALSSVSLSHSAAWTTIGAPLSSSNGLPS